MIVTQREGGGQYRQPARICLQHNCVRDTVMLKSPLHALVAKKRSKGADHGRLSHDEEGPALTCDSPYRTWARSGINPDLTHFYRHQHTTEFVNLDLKTWSV